MLQKFLVVAGEKQKTAGGTQRLKKEKSITHFYLRTPTTNRDSPRFPKSHQQQISSTTHQIPSHDLIIGVEI